MPVFGPFRSESEAEPYYQLADQMQPSDEPIEIVTELDPESALLLSAFYPPDINMVVTEEVEPELSHKLMDAFIPYESRLNFDPQEYLQTLEEFISKKKHRFRGIYEWTRKKGTEAIFGCGMMMKTRKVYANTVLGSRRKVTRRLDEGQMPIFDAHTHPVARPGSYAKMDAVLAEANVPPWDPEWKDFPSAQDYLAATRMASGAEAVIMPSGRMLMYAVVNEDRLAELIHHLYKEYGMEEHFGEASTFDMVMRMDQYPNTAIGLVFILNVEEQGKSVQIVKEFNVLDWPHKPGMR